MMKWKARTETTNIGTLELGNLTFDEDYIQVSIDICNMSDNLKSEVIKAIDARKIESIKEWEDVYSENPDLEKLIERRICWSNAPAVIDYTYLDIILEADKETSYSIEIVFHDSENDCLEERTSIAVDLSKYQNELKKMIIKVLVDKFF
ncbi:MAG: hypothetical protein NC485_15115 [Ruminococcus flavefaciens]|nr:hypothetical protein [Ruminococcus flavefaciens]